MRTCAIIHPLHLELETALSTPNPRLRKGINAKDQLFYWLRFSLDAIDHVTNASGSGGYQPTVVADGIELSAFKQLAGC